MINPSAAAVLSARIAYSTLHGLTLMIGAHKKNAASGLIPNADVQKTIRDRISAVSLFVQILPLVRGNFRSSFKHQFLFPSLSARAAAHFGCMVGRYSLADTEKPGGISLLTIGRTGRCPVVGFVYCNCIIFADK